MSTGGGNSVLESIIDVAIQGSTAGLLGFSSDEGGLGTGIVGEAGVDVLKEVSGAKAAEEANEDARRRVDEERARIEEQTKQNQAQSAANQLAASRSAASARGGVSTPSSTGQSRFSNLGSDEADFLGL